MTVGLITSQANAVLNMLFRNVTPTPPAATFIKLHIGDPGVAGTSNASAVTTRQSSTYSAAASGAISLSNTPTFSMTTSETISHVSIWDASSAGNVIATQALTTPKAVANGDTLVLNSESFNLTPLMA